MLARFGVATGLAALAALCSPALAYVPTSTSAFAEMAGSAAAISARDSILDPAGYALYQRIYAIKGISDRDAAGLVAFYTHREFKPAWSDSGKLTDPAKAIIARIAKADEDGLDAKFFAMPAVDMNAAGGDAIAEADVKLSLAIVTYARQAQIGRVNPSSIDENIGFEPVAPNPSEVLAAVTAASDPAAVLAAYNPPQEGFKRLRAKLAELRGAPQPAMETIANGPVLKAGMSDPRVAKLRARLELPANEATPGLYDNTLADAVKAFQQAKGLGANGQLNPPTVAALNRGIIDRTGEVLANMERWRWMPRDLGRFYVWVDVPGFMVHIYKDGALFFSTRIVVGKPENKTPIFSDNIQHVIVNPFWNVPVSITAKEMLPTIQRDPTSLTRSNYEVLANVGGRYQIVDPRQIDWTTANLKQIQIRQRPGEGNALGNIKFMFPNKYAVYLHDTPSKALFQRTSRAFSHGCMRVMDPFAFADALLSEDKELTSAKIKKLVGGPEQQMNMSKHVPVHITYFTARVDDSGRLEFVDDVYGHSAKVRKALGL